MRWVLCSDRSHAVEARVIVDRTELQFVEPAVVEDQSPPSAIYFNGEIAWPAHRHPTHLKQSSGTRLESDERL